MVSKYVKISFVKKIILMNLVCLVVYMLFIYVNSKVDLRVIDVGLLGI